MSFSLSLTFSSRYVVRAKAGQRQAAKDAGGGKVTTLISLCFGKSFCFKTTVFFEMLLRKHCLKKNQAAQQSLFLVCAYTGAVADSERRGQ